MKKKILIGLIVLISFIAPIQHSCAQTPILEVIKAGVKRIIKAVDLKIQRMQNDTIWLQNAQKTLENAMSKLKLDEIGSWTDRQRELYKKYFEELNKVKSLIIYYQRIKDIGLMQLKMIKEYESAWNNLKNDHHFNSKEIDYMSKVYSGMLAESAENIDQITMVIKAFGTQMNDSKRIQIINSAADKIESTYADLVQFNQQNIGLVLQRAKTQNDIDVVKKLYGLK